MYISGPDPALIELFHWLLFPTVKVSDKRDALRAGGISPEDKAVSVLIPEAVPVFSEDPVKQEYMLQFVTLGLEGIEEVWIRRGFQESIEEIVEMAEKMLREGIFSL